MDYARYMSKEGVNYVNQNCSIKILLFACRWPQDGLHSGGFGPQNVVLILENIVDKSLCDT